MSDPQKILKDYYGESGDYLKDHDSFLQTANLNEDCLFLIKALDLQKDDNILDIACGQGRHTNTLAEKEYVVDGVDFSEFLIGKAKEDSKKIKAARLPNYYVSDVESLNLENNYSKAFWFFSDLAGIDAEKAVKSISDKMKPGGKILFDFDNIFRLVSHLDKKPNPDYFFDAKKLELIDKKTNLHVSYPTYPMWEKWLANSGLEIERTWGDYQFGDYSTTSPRLILVVKKIA